MDKRYSIAAIGGVVASVLALVVATNSVHAAPNFLSYECIQSGTNTEIPDWHRGSGGTSTEIYYYIQSDFAAELTACTPAADNQLTEDMLRAVVDAAVAKWNLQARSISLVPAGVVAEQAFVDACTTQNMPLRPAVFVHHTPGCLEDSNSVCTQRSGEIAADKVMCGSDVVRVTIAGDKNGWMSNDDCGGTEVIDWGVGLDTTQSDLQSVLVHEFGHVLNLGHPNQITVGGIPISDPTNGASIMKSNVSLTPYNRHLYNFEQDCGDDYGTNNGRSVRYHWKGRNSTGTWVEIHDYSGATSKGVLSGGHVRTSSGTPYTSMWLGSPDNGVPAYREGYLGVDGFISFGYQSHQTDILAHHVDITPVVSSLLELPHGQDGNSRRLSLHRVLSRTDTQPPELRFVADDDPFTSTVEDTYFECMNPYGSFCLGWSPPLRSHVPMATAWDPESGLTVFARVNSERNFTMGGITIHAGTQGSSDTLGLGSMLTGTVNLPSDSYSLWDYAGTTEVAVALACGDGGTLTYNCMVAWQDNGIPSGHVLYTYFYVDSSGSIVWRPSSAIRRSGVSSVEHLSAAYFEGRYWLAWKSSDIPARVKFVSHPDTSYTSWSSTSTAGGDYVIDPPTWISSPTLVKEKALLWTETP